MRDALSSWRRLGASSPYAGLLHDMSVWHLPQGPLSPSTHIVYVANQKAASESVVVALRRKGFAKRRSLGLDLAGDAIFAFTFVREPVAKLESGIEQAWVPASNDRIDLRAKTSVKTTKNRSRRWW